MTRLAFVFPGQGAQYVGMGKELAENYKEALAVFSKADEVLGIDLSSICFEGPAELLDCTVITQPAVLTTSIAACAVAVQKGIVPSIVAGLSLGEYTALVASGSLEFSDALVLLKNRGRLMQEAVPNGQGAMAAVLGAENSLVEEICENINGIVDVSNYNSPGQVAISGEKEAVILASSRLQESGAKVVPLSVSVPSHGRMMRGAAEKLESYLQPIDFKPPAFGVVSNVNAAENQAEDFKDLLVRQLYCPVRWEQSMAYMMERADYFVEVGPGNVLSGFIKRMDRKRLLGHIEDVESLEKVLQRVGEL